MRDPRKKKKRYGDVIFVIFIVFFLYQIITSYFLTPFIVKHDAMSPEFSEGSRILASPLYRISSLKRGSLVLIEQNEKSYNFIQKTINAVVGFLSLNIYIPFDKQSSPSTKYLLRRIVGCPGDVIYMKDFILYVKPKNEQHFLTEFEVAEFDYNINTEGLSSTWKKDLPFSGHMEEMELKEGEYFVLSDNRLQSFDSRLIGKINAREAIKQKVVLRYWPLNKIKFF